MKLGSHVSLKAPDFLLGSLQEAKSYGADCLMFYTGAPQNTIRVELKKMRIEEANRFDSDLIRICHAPYVLNLANPDDSKRAFSISFLQEEANRAFRLGARCIVLHPGSSLGQGFEEAARHVANSLDSLSLPIPIALETMAGKGSEIGRSLEEIAYLLSLSRQDLRVCLDTCHLSDAGYDLSDPDAFLNELERFFPLEKVAVIHLNDSKNPRGSHKDRHENIGYGAIGFKTLYGFASHPRLKDIPIILETPYFEGKAPYGREIAMLRKGEFSDWR